MLIKINKINAMFEHQNGSHDQCRNRNADETIYEEMNVNTKVEQIN